MIAHFMPWDKRTIFLASITMMNSKMMQNTDKLLQLIRSSKGNHHILRILKAVQLMMIESRGDKESSKRSTLNNRNTKSRKRDIMISLKPRRSWVEQIPRISLRQRRRATVTIERIKALFLPLKKRAQQEVNLKVLSKKTAFLLLQWENSLQMKILEKRAEKREPVLRRDKVQILPMEARHSFILPVPLRVTRETLTLAQTPLLEISIQMME